MSRHSLRLLPLLLLLCAAPATARRLEASIARVATPVATLEGVRVRLDWPAQATRGDLVLRARRVDAADLGYRYRDMEWRCPLQRHDNGGWRCEGELRSGRARPLRLALVLGTATTDAVLSQGPARFALRRQAATPDFTALELTRVPAAWAQALLAQAWPAGRLQAGHLDGRLDVQAPKDRPLRITGSLGASGLGLDTPDGSIAAENLGGRFDLDYRKFPQRALLELKGQLRGGEVLVGNAYIALPATPVEVQLTGEQAAGEGWRLPRILWRDGNVLVAEGSAELAPDAAVRELDLRLRSGDVGPLRDRYLSGWLGLAGLGDLDMRGALDASVQVRGGRLLAANADLHEIDLTDPQGRFRFEGLSGAPRFSAGTPVAGELRWRGGELYGLPFGPAVLPVDSSDGAIRLREAVSVPAFGGSLRFDGLTLRPPADGRKAEARFGLTVDRIDIAQLSQALGWPAFRGELSGRIPDARYADDRLEFDGGLTMALFEGRVTVSSLSMERPFGVAPTLSADVDLDDIDLFALTEVFDFGSITGRLDGRIHDLRLVDWTATAFDADLRTDRKRGVKQRISATAVQNISSVGDASFASTLQSRLIGLFDDFGYARIGISCRLANEVCEMGGLRSAGNAFTILEGSGLPRLTVIGHNRSVDWPTLVERLAAVGKGDVKPVVQ